MEDTKTCTACGHHCPEGAECQNGQCPECHKATVDHSTETPSHEGSSESSSDEEAPAV